MSKPEKVLPLTSLRFFAALGIVFHHYFESSFPVLKQERWVSPLIDYSAVGVYFFFVLSGYILGYVYLRGDGTVDRRRFWIARFARIYPLYIVTILVSVPRLLSGRIVRFGAAKAVLGTGATFTAHALLLQHWIPQLGALNYPSWSISAEAFFYLVFPWVGVWLWQGTMRRAMLLGAAWFVVTWSWIAVGKSWPRFNLYPHVMPLFELNLFVIGIVLAKVHAAILQSARGAERLARWGGVLAGCAMGLFLIFTEWKPVVPFGAVHDAFAAILFLMMVLGFASGNRLIQSVFGMGWLVVLGESSYGLYLIHAPLWDLLLVLHLRPSPVLFILYVLGAVGLSVGSFYSFETPARRAILRYFSTRSRESTATAAIAQ
jgi:peptidoglycan/LPS O-acetylase OafA/YrhL